MVTSDTIKKFTVKDFIKYNNPCFNCNKNIFLELSQTTIASSGISGYGWNTYKLQIVNNSIEIDLNIKYASTLKLIIYPKNNKYLVSDINSLKAHLKNQKLFLINKCLCGTVINSEFLEFDYDKKIIKPITLYSESLTININDKKQYNIDTFFALNITYYHLDGQTDIEGPILPLYKVKNKEKLIQKIKTYITFS